MATFVKFQQFAVDLAQGVHDLQTANSQLFIVLSNTAPVVATDAVLTDITQIAYTNITETFPHDIDQSGAENPGGTWEVTAADVVVNATGAVAEFRYVILYNGTPTSPADPLIGYWDYGSGVTLAAGETFTVDLGANVFTVA